MTQRYFPNDMPPPLADAETLPWWQAAAEHRLVVQRCTGCGHFRHPPGPACAECRSLDSEWVELPGRGRVYTYTIVHRPVSAAQAGQLPFIIAVIEPEGADGVRLMSNLVEVDPEAVEIGLPVEVVWEDMGPELSVPRFRPA